MVPRQLDGVHEATVSDDVEDCTHVPFFSSNALSEAVLS